jgi:C4-dicarboxylate-binding protein DctP
MRAAKLFCWNGDPASTDAWKAGNFKPVLLSAVDMLPSLQTGMIDTVLYPPVLVFSLRLFDKAKYMMDMPYSTLTGATIIEKKVWDQIPPDLRPKLKDVFIALGKDGTQQARNFENEALAKMKQQGLQVVPITDQPEWDKAVKDVRLAIRGKVVPTATFDEVTRIVQEYRSSHK